MFSDLPIEEYFQYQPPKTEDRLKKHEAINTAALEFAKAIDQNVVDSSTRDMALAFVMQARMFANQGITVDEIMEKSIE